MITETVLLPRYETYRQTKAKERSLNLHSAVLAIHRRNLFNPFAIETSLLRALEFVARRAAKC